MVTIQRNETESLCTVIEVTWRIYSCIISTGNLGSDANSCV